MPSYNGEGSVKIWTSDDEDFMLVTTQRVAEGYRTRQCVEYRAKVREAFGFPYSGLIPIPLVVDDILFERKPRDVARVMVSWRRAIGSCFSAAVKCDLTKRQGQLFETTVDKLRLLPIRTEVDLFFGELVSSSG